MVGDKKALLEALQSLEKDLRAKFNELKMRASGTWEQSLSRTVETPTGHVIGTIYGESYTEYLTGGRPPSEKRPPIKAIEQWIKDKGIARSAKKESEITAMAFAIAETIRRHGTRYYRQGGTDLISAVVTPARIQEIIDTVSPHYLSDITATILNQIQQISYGKN